MFIKLFKMNKKVSGLKLLSGLTNQPINQLTNQLNQSTNQPINQLIN